MCSNAKAICSMRAARCDLRIRLVTCRPMPPRAPRYVRRVGEPLDSSERIGEKRDAYPHRDVLGRRLSGTSATPMTEIRILLQAWHGVIDFARRHVKDAGDWVALIGMLSLVLLYSGVLSSRWPLTIAVIALAAVCLVVAHSRAAVRKPVEWPWRCSACLVFNGETSRRCSCGNDRPATGSSAIRARTE